MQGAGISTSAGGKDIMYDWFTFTDIITIILVIVPDFRSGMDTKVETG